jgi:hypothetical protein
MKERRKELDFKITRIAIAMLLNFLNLYSYE